MKLYLSIFMSLLFGFLQAQEQLALYSVIPNKKDTADISKNSPALYAYIPSEIKHAKVFLIFPGGGYHHLAMDHEGHQVAKRLSDLGYCAFVLKYRLPSAKQQIDKRIAPIQDAQQAMVVVKDKVTTLKMKKPSIGVVGFSAGGHLASTLSTHFETDYQAKKISSKLLRPDFSILVYPVISMVDGVTHNGSKTNLIGPDFSDTDLTRFSNEKQITENTPPAFLIHAKDDKAVPIENSLLYQRALDNYKIPNYLFSYELGGHGFGMNNKKEPKDWFVPMLEWVEKVKM
ncbi:alpha/beta hydrolase [Sphingobacterium bovistauri]|uniref:Alpha/beta hydrolase n=1 Tax=Sphingobacterium bovistauri TaxID=2781959 RepID=A0ABS7ZBD8_9SPHI|nr:alpha/beta hydrolase [Sphingobacterium bovistauri]MCA5006029.1 alpha/beta hydrolase [Sphingobacterium bovistauri]